MSKESEQLRQGIRSLRLTLSRWPEIDVDDSKGLANLEHWLQFSPTDPGRVLALQRRVESVIALCRAGDRDEAITGLRALLDEGRVDR